MNKTKICTLVWLLCSLLCALLALTLVGHGLAGRAWVPEPERIPETAHALLQSLQEGNWEALEQLVAADTPVRPRTGAPDSAQALLWEAYRQSLQWTRDDGFGIQGDCVTQAVTVTCLDISQSAAAMTQTGDTPGPEGPAMTRKITLKLIRKDGHWQILPDKALLALLAGFTT